MDVFYHGIWRMDWGLGNPNNTAALIAGLMIAVWGLAFVGRWGFWVALSLSTVLGACLIHTFSRGGLIAAIAGLAPLALLAPRPWPWRKLAAIGVSICMLIGFTLYLNAHQRYAQGVLKEDRSITNRLHLWKHAPAMIVDAPGGWGKGNAAEAYMQWYQPIEDTKSYRTFVNSHLEWLIEFSWPARFLYIFCWIAALLLCFPIPRIGRWLAVPFGVILSFAIAAFFSSVAESAWNWVLPVTAVVIALAYRIHGRHPIPIPFWCAPLAAAMMICLGLWTAGAKGTQVGYIDNRLTLGEGKPPVWLVVDRRMLGDKYGKDLRGYLAAKSFSGAVGVVRSISELPENVSGATVIIAGSPSGQPELTRVTDSIAKLILLAPGFYPKEAGLEGDKLKITEAIFGEFSQSPYALAWIETGCVQRISATGDFMPSWPEFVLK